MKKVDELKIAVLCGGRSDERQVSLTSGSQVYEALLAEGCNAVLIDTYDSKAAVKTLIEGDFDVAYIALHGKGGEDGTIQGALETICMPYTGSGVLGSALAMDKARAKAQYAANGLPVAASVLVTRDDQLSTAQICETVGQKCVVKPVGDGSSVGMSIVHSEDELPAALEKAFKTGQSVLVETFVAGTEVTCAVLGNDDPQALPVIEIVPHAEFYDFEVKYSAAGADHIIPARLEESVYQTVQEYAVRAHKALDCRGVSRSDFIVREDGTPIILETNTIPGMTSTSLLPDAAKHAGYGFGQLCMKIVELAME